ncbi:putative protease PrsW (Protease responsible for activating sigma-W) [Treponema primitia ZAS-2]|uniref:Putative protease PrsW (Protease responsible for activating sigma-W) n=1 Tax=Treponema primitia (strain ATCC BAA-887 / DSM 12427 / ZAS-2) TaxID=545694 RepID=F5YN87_TREPZ|nr:PrsW family glutamic-type intramembrane protease [Treponema primitia]AEF84349.1 putative protease PrsW (Protease responsible for activating sigma-W) [Treponema primitia ZAS-2]
MNGIWVLLLLIGLSALPILAVLLWIRLRHFPIKLPWFLLGILGGALSLGVAAILQSLFPKMGEATISILLFKIFIQIALTEELSRFGVLFLFFWGFRRISKNQEFYTPAFSSLMGLIVGLGFAVIETAMYGVGNFRIALIRAVTAAPLHGACGIRIGLGTYHLGDAPTLALVRFLYAVGIHGIYNFMLVSPGIPVVFPVLIAFTALLSSMQMIRYSGSVV